MWAIVEVISLYLNLVVNACVMNQSKGHRLLSNVLNITINLIGIGIWTKSPYWGKTFDQFDVEFHLLKRNMWHEVMKVVSPLGLGMVGWTKSAKKILVQRSFCKIYNVHNVDTWGWQNDIYPVLAKKFHMWFVHRRG
jgi:hypothetical protein